MCDIPTPLVRQQKKRGRKKLDLPIHDGMRDCPSCFHTKDVSEYKGQSIRCASCIKTRKKVVCRVCNKDIHTVNRRDPFAHAICLDNFNRKKNNDLLEVNGTD